MINLRPSKGRRLIMHDVVRGIHEPASTVVTIRTSLLYHLSYLTSYNLQVRFT